jgi:hypothetical protein
MHDDKAYAFKTFLCNFLSCTAGSFCMNYHHIYVHWLLPGLVQKALIYDPCNFVFTIAMNRNYHCNATLSFINFSQSENCMAP